MNYIDRTIFNTTTQTWRVASELVKAQGKRKRNSSSKQSLLLLTALGALSFTPSAHADTATCNNTSCNPNIRYIERLLSIAPPKLSPSTDNTNPNNNTVTITGIPISNLQNVYGAFRDDNTAVSGNQVRISGGFVYGEVYGGYVDNANVTNNKVAISGGSFNWIVYGGRSDYGNVTNNTVTISGGSFSRDIYGGHSKHANASNNTVTISGGSLSEDVFGGKTWNGNATNNTVTIKKGSDGNPTFGKNILLYGGYASKSSSTADVKSGNTLNMHTTDITVKNIKNFENLHFYVQKDTPANATFLTLTDTADTDIRGAAIGVGIEGNDTLLKKGDKVVLIHKSNATGKLLTDAGLNNTATGMKGISTLYDFNLKKQDDQTLIATLTSATRINPQVKSLSEARLAAVNFVNRGADLAAGAGLENLLKTTQNGGIQGFAALGSGKTRTKTGSHIDVKGMNLILGAGTQLPNASGTLTVGGFVEGGKGSYDSYNDFVDRPEVRANGKTHYYGVGLLAKQQFNNDWFVDGGVRLGKSKMDYYSADLVDGSGKHTRFSSKASYWGANVGVGKSIELNETNTLTPYAKLSYTHYDSDRQKIAGDTFDFSDSHSLRSRLGVRWTHQLNETSELYAGAAWEHEFKGTAKGKVLGFDMPEPSLKGNTGIIDVGMNFTPNENLNIGVGVQGEFGKRRGVSATAKVKYSF